MDQQQNADALSSKRIYLGNLPYAAQSTDVEKYLEDAGFQIERLDMSTDPFTGRNPSYCFAELFSVEEAQRAISLLPGASFMGRPLRVNVHTPKSRNGVSGGTPLRSSPRPALGTERSWRGQPSTNSNPGTPSKENGDGYAFNRWERKDAASHFTAPVEENRRLYVGGLPRMDGGQEAVNEQMKAVFKDYAVEAVSKLHSPHESTQTLPGDHHYCFVDMPSTEEAQEAANALNGTASPWGGNLKVNLARKSDRKVLREQNLTERPERTERTERPERTERAEKPTPVRDFGSSWRRAN